ncbi:MULTISPECIES: SipW-dependent-type signal peptide-containing protein [Bacteria]|uniref:SipW-dependent-type signal peptide-containing protein n=1 Tax=Bacteria TaxID=2 RepID=UPI003C7ED009
MSKTTNRRKILAVLAGGLVLGVGAAITLAAWNDSEFATGTFTAGNFNLEGSTTAADGGYDDHATAGAAGALTFTAPFGNMAPGDVVYAPFWVRLDDTTTTDATLAAATPTAVGANAANISYNVYAIAPAATCDPSAASGTLVASGTSLTDFTAGATVALAKGATAGTAGVPTQLCFQATAKPSLAQGQTATGTWSFTATSS